MMVAEAKETNGSPTTNDVLDNEAKRLANRAQFVFNEYIANLTTTRQELYKRLLDPRRDLDSECGYPNEITLEDYGKMYDREGIGTRVVSVWPDECWVQDPSIDENEDSEDTPFEKAWKMIEERLNLFHYMHRADELSGVGAFGGLLLGFSDGRGLDQPVPGIIPNGPKAGQRQGQDEGNPDPSNPMSSPRNSKLKLNFVRVFDQRSITVADFDTDERSPRFGQPMHYNVILMDPRANVAATGASALLPGEKQHTKIHWTRIVHIADNRKSNEVFGTPRMQAVWNRLMDLRKLLGGSAEMFWKGAFFGLSFETHPELGEVDIDYDKLRNQFAEFANGLNRFLATTGMSAKSIAPQVADPQNHIMAQMQAIAVQIGVPWRQFIGSEQAQLASGQDRDSLNKRIKRRREKYLSPQIVRPVIDRLITVGVLPTPTGMSRAEPEGEDVEQGQPTGEEEERRDRVRPRSRPDPEQVEQEVEEVLGDEELTDVGSYPYSVNWPEIEETSTEEKALWVDAVVKAIAQYIQSGAAQLIPEKEFLTKVLDFDEDEAEAMLAAAEAVIEEMEIEKEQEFEQQKELMAAKSGGGEDDDNAPPPQPPTRRG